MAGWHHQLNGREFEWTPGAGDGQGVLACCDSWGHKESDMTEWLKWTELNWTGKIIALIIRTYVSKVMSLLWNMLSRLVITFLPRSKCYLISWLQSSSAVILEPPKIKSATVPVISPFICHEVIGSYAMILVFWMLSFKPAFSLLFHFHQEALYFFAFCHKSDVITLSEVIDISPSNHDSSFCFIQPSISHDLLCI